MPPKRRALGVLDPAKKKRDEHKEQSAEWMKELAAEAAGNQFKLNLLAMSGRTHRLRGLQPEAIVCNYFDSVRKARGAQSCRVLPGLVAGAFTPARNCFGIVLIVFFDPFF